MKKIFALVAASAIFLSIAVAAHAIDDPRYARLCGHTVPDGTQLELYGVTDEERGISDIVAVVTKGGAEERIPLCMYDSRYEPELAVASPSGGAPDEVMMRVFAGGGTGIHIEELYLLRPYADDEGCALAVFQLEGDQLARLASELVDIRAEGSKVSFVRSEKAGDAGSVLFSIEADAPVKLDDKEMVFTQQVRYRFGDDGRAIACISPVLATEEMPAWCDETIEFDVRVGAGADGARSFSLSDPRLGKTTEQ